MLDLVAGEKSTAHVSFRLIMQSVDGVEESRRLQELYAHLTDEELQAVADTN
jgi:hypothetical protein